VFKWDFWVSVMDYGSFNFDRKVAVSQVLFGLRDWKCSSLVFVWVWSISPRLLERIVGVVLRRDLRSHLFLFLYFGFCLLYWALSDGSLHLNCHFWLCFFALLKIIFGDIVYDVGFCDVAPRSSCGYLWRQDAVFLKPEPNWGSNFSRMQLLMKLVGKLRCCKGSMAKSG